MSEYHSGFRAYSSRVLKTVPFEKNSDDIHPNYASMIMTNQTDPANLFVIATLARYNAATDDMESDSRVLGNSSITAFDDTVIFMGDITGTANPTLGITAAQDAKLKLNDIASARVTGAVGGNVKDASNNTITGMKWAVNAPNDKYIWDSGTYQWVVNPSPDNPRESYDISGDPNLYEYDAEPFCIGNDCTNTSNRIWIARENYVIGNGGDIKAVADFTSASEDPFTILKNTAGETIWYVKKDINTTQTGFNRVDNTSTGDYFLSKTNLDVVVIPDIVLAAVQRMMSALTAMNE